MPPRLPPRSFVGRRVVLSARNSSNTRNVAPVCSICSLTRAPSNTRQPVPSKSRQYAAVASIDTATHSKSGDPRRDLEAALQDLQKDAANYVNLSRIRLALQGLRQEPGREAIRIAILGLSTRGRTGDAARTAKEVLRLLLADPLSPTAPWENQIWEHDLRKPLVVRVSKEGSEAKKVDQIQFGSSAQQRGGLFHEVQISSPELNGHEIEVLVTEVNSLKEAIEFEEAVLVPTVDIQSGDTRYSPITTPVHKALIVGNGLLGAAEAINLPLTGEGDTITGAINMPSYNPDEATVKSVPFTLLDIPRAEKALSVFRESLNNAMEYEHLWSESNASLLSTWLRAGSLTTADGTTKPSVLALIKSLLSQTQKRVDAASTALTSFRRPRSASPKTSALQKALEDWAEKAHRELQDGLEPVFTGTRWRRIGWWKLFWRVDDVGMITNELLNRHFLVEADRDVVYLAGRIEEAGVFDGTQKGYIAPKPLSPDPETVEALEKRMASKNAKVEPKPEMEPETKHETKLLNTYTQLPQHITHTRTYLTSRTVPALQALAQKLVIQTVSTTGTTSVLGGLMYASSFSTESAAAIVAFGLVWSLRRLQNKWESAREFWAGEVREEGRKAVRAVESCVDEALQRSAKQGERQVEGMEEVEKANRALERAKEALERIK